MAKTVAQLIADIDAQIDLLIASNPVDYTEGDVTYKASQKIKNLRELRADLIKQGANPGDPDIAIMHFNHVINEFGVDSTEYQ